MRTTSVSVLQRVASCCDVFCLRSGPVQACLTLSLSKVKTSWMDLRDAWTATSQYMWWSGRNALLKCGQIRQLHLFINELIRIFYALAHFRGLRISTFLRNTVDLLMKLLGLRWSHKRAGQLRVDIVRDGLHRCSQTIAACAQVAGSELETSGRGTIIMGLFKTGDEYTLNRIREI